MPDGWASVRSAGKPAPRLAISRPHAGREVRRRPGTGPAILALALGAVATQLSAQPESAPQPGHERALDLQDIRTERLPAPEIDGSVDDAVWAATEASGGFWNSARDRAPTSQTEVLAARDAENLYFAFRLYEAAPDTIQSTRTVRDGGLGFDDRITVELDTFFNRRDISKFSVNPIGTQDDEIAGGRSDKIEWKGDWQGAAVRTDYGWSAEFAIPFAILNYGDDTSRFGINFSRYQSSTRETSYWADVTPQDREEEMGYMTMPELPPRQNQSAWTFMPFAFAGRNIEDDEGDVDSALVTAGIDVRFEPRSDLTGVFSLNPDLSQVEEAITDISFSYSERSLDDNRPFFEEGADYFSDEDDDEKYFYSNRIPDFDTGAKSFGRTGRLQYGLLGTLASSDRSDFVGRALFEVDDTNSAIAQLIHSNRNGLDNTLAVAQFRGRQPSGLNYSIDYAASDTSNRHDPELPNGDGVHYDASIGWRSDYLYTSASADRYETGFFPANGRIDEDLPGTRGENLSLGYIREFRHETLRQVDSYIGVSQRDTLTGLEQSERVFAGGSVEFTSDIRVSFYTEQGPYRPVSDERGIFEDEIFDDHYSSVWIDFNTRSNRLAGGIQLDDGNLGGGDYEYISAYAWWRPSNTVYFKATAERIDSFGVSDQVVLESTWDISPEHSLSGRYIAADDDDLLRVAYAHRARQGLDIFAVYDRSRTGSDEFSIKLVATF